MDVNELITYLVTPVAQVAIIIGLVEVIKRLGCPARWLPVIDVLFGLASGIGFYGLGRGYGVMNGVMLGLALGLSACGLFSGIKNVAQIRKDE